MAEATGQAGRCRTFRVANAWACLSRAAAADDPTASRSAASRPRCGSRRERPGTWEGPGVTVIHISTAPLIHSYAGA